MMPQQVMKLARNTQTLAHTGAFGQQDTRCPEFGVQTPLIFPCLRLLLGNKSGNESKTRIAYEQCGLKYGGDRRKALAFYEDRHQRHMLDNHPDDTGTDRHQPGYDAGHDHQQPRDLLVFLGRCMGKVFNAGVEPIGDGGHLGAQGVFEAGLMEHVAGPPPRRRAAAVAATPPPTPWPPLLVLLRGQAESADIAPGNRLPDRGTPEGAAWEPLYRALDAWDTQTIVKWIGPQGWINPSGATAGQVKETGTGGPPGDNGGGKDLPVPQAAGEWVIPWTHPAMLVAGAVVVVATGAVIYTYAEHRSRRRLEEALASQEAP